MPQTSHPRKMTVGRIGQLDDSSDWKDARTFVNADTVVTTGADVHAFGTLVSDELNGTCKRLDAQADKLAGVVILSDAYDDPNEAGLSNETSNPPGVRPGTPVSCLQRGRIRVMLDETVAAGDPVRYYAKPVAGKRTGAFRTSDPTGTDTVLIATGARFVEGGTVATGAVLEFDILAMTFTADS